LTVGPSLGMALFHYGPAVLWLSCGALGLAAAGIILAGTGMPPALKALRHDHNSAVPDPTLTPHEVE